MSIDHDFNMLNVVSKTPPKIRLSSIFERSYLYLKEAHYLSYPQADNGHIKFDRWKVANARLSRPCSCP